jgi:hypothetical protein
MENKLHIVNCEDPTRGKYRIACDVCHLVSVASMHGDVECWNCHTREKAHDMLLEFELLYPAAGGPQLPKNLAHGCAHASSPAAGESVREDG